VTVFSFRRQHPSLAGDPLMQTTTINAVLAVNDPGSESALTITPAAGGPAPAAASPVIERSPR